MKRIDRGGNRLGDASAISLNFAVNEPLFRFFDSIEGKVP